MCTAHLYIQLHGVCASVVSSVILRITDIQLNELVYSKFIWVFPGLWTPLERELGASRLRASALALRASFLIFDD